MEQSGADGRSEDGAEGGEGHCLRFGAKRMK